MPNLNKRQFDPDNPQPYFTKSGVGKLFPDPKPTDEHRYQRGFTPERKRDVELAAPVISGPGDRPAYPGQTKQEQGEFMASMYDTLARSTMPTRHIERTDFVQQETPERLGGPEVGGLHDRPDGWRRVRLNAEVDPRSLGPTLIHEMGHGLDNHNLRDKFDHTNPPGPVPDNPLSDLFGLGPLQRQSTRDYPFVGALEEAPKFKGAAEKFADDYMMEHYRPDPRDKSAVTNVEHTYPAKGVPVDEYEGWHSRVRESMIARNRRRGSTGYPQDPMFEPVD